ncbi:BSD domain-containing protein [Apiospora phragmitis]|uniref:BSD domain-containing protein n=1 Tax=Apiospora phragmitis TaxID=2905665 RepID=A0ABR1WSM9_9PEZI
MAIPRGTAAYKKKDGILTVTDDQKTIIWTPQANPSGPPGITLAISNVTNLQQTPDTAAKVMLKIFEKAKEGAEPVSYLFHFNSPTDPRGKRIVPRPAGAGGSASGSMAFASAVNSKPASARFFDDAQLKMDIELQQSLMKTDRSLHQMYMEGRATKPESMSDAVFNMQFWSTRINLLRAHAIERSQKKGPYNVLATVKPIIEQSTEPDKPNTMKLNITVEQVRMIFDQHPLVKKIYNENVPPLSEGEFWERFFLYDEYEDITAFSSKLLSQHVPHIIDIEGNEEKPSISGKMLANVSAADSGPADSAGSDDIYNQLALRDLRAEAEESKIILNIKEQSQFFSNQANAASAAEEIFAKQNPTKLLKHVQGDLGLLRDDGAGGVDFQASLSINDESDSDDDEKKKKAHILESILQRRAQMFGHSSDETTPMGLPAEVAAKCNLTHATTMEFLHQFWSAFLSGDPDRAAELGYLLESLKRSKERINVVAVEAQKAREQEIERKKEEIRQIYQRTGKKRKLNTNAVRGGKDAVVKLMGPVVKSLDTAIAAYQKALAAEGIQASTEA